MGDNKIEFNLLQVVKARGIFHQQGGFWAVCSFSWTPSTPSSSSGNGAFSYSADLVQRGIKHFYDGTQINIKTIARIVILNRHK